MKGYILIDGQVKKIILLTIVWAPNGKLLEEHVLSVFIGDVLDHNCGSTIKFDGLIVDRKGTTFLGCD